MSIYQTCWTAKLPKDGYGPPYYEVYCQRVPGWINYTGPTWEWLPPPVKDRDAARAYFICGPRTQKGSDRNGQEYRDYLVMLSGAEYEAMPWPVLWEKIAATLPGHLRRRNV